MSPLLGDGFMGPASRPLPGRIDRAVDRDHADVTLVTWSSEAVNWTRVVCVVVLTVIDTAVEVRAPPALSRATAVRL